MAKVRLPKLPPLLERKISKTGQTRGADDDVIYRNRVARSGTVLIPYSCWRICKNLLTGETGFENGFIVLLSPSEYFGVKGTTRKLKKKGLTLGENALVFYETREQWHANNPRALKWKEARRRTDPLGGQYVARIAATTAVKNGGKIVRGFSATKMKGAGIRVYEYAGAETLNQCRLQLEALFWLCKDAGAVARANGMTPTAVRTRRAAVFDNCKKLELLNVERLKRARILGRSGNTICPFCLKGLSGKGFFNRLEQAVGRVVHDLTVTQINLFHIMELRIDALNHRPYNVGWGHHHCNVVVKDSGIQKTVRWIRDVLNRNVKLGYLAAEKRTN